MIRLYVGVMWLFLTMRKFLRIHAIRATARRVLVAPGQGLVEYALILVLLAIVVIGTLSSVGDSTNDTFEQVRCNLAGKEWHSDNGQGSSNRCR